MKHSVTCFWNIYSDLAQSSFSIRILTNQVTRGCFWFDDLKEGVRPGSHSKLFNPNFCQCGSGRFYIQKCYTECEIRENVIGYQASQEK